MIDEDRLHQKEIIEKATKILNVNKADLAIELGVQKPNLYNWFNGKRPMPLYIHNSIQCMIDRENIRIERDNLKNLLNSIRDAIRNIPQH